MKELIIPTYQANKNYLNDRSSVEGMLEKRIIEEEIYYYIHDGVQSFQIDLSTLAISFNNGVHWRSIQQVERTWR
jgi:hypothetical protein